MGPKLDISRFNEIQSKVHHQSTTNLLVQNQGVVDMEKEIVYIPPLSGKNSVGFGNSVLQSNHQQMQDQNMQTLKMDELPSVEKFFRGDGSARSFHHNDVGGKKGSASSSIPSRINSRAGSNFVSQQALDTTQIVPTSTRQSKPQLNNKLKESASLSTLHRQLKGGI